MSTKLKITEKEILDKPNDAELGSYIRRKYLIQKETMKKNVDVGMLPSARTARLSKLRPWPLWSRPL